MKRNPCFPNLPQVTGLSRFILSNLDRGRATYIAAACAGSVLEMTRQLQAPKQSAQQPPIASMSCFTAWGGNNGPARSAFKGIISSQSLAAALDNMLQSFSLLNQRPFFTFLPQSWSRARCTIYPGREEHFWVRHKKPEAMTHLYVLGHCPLYKVLK